MEQFDIQFDLRKVIDDKTVGRRCPPKLVVWVKRGSDVMVVWVKRGSDVMVAWVKRGSDVMVAWD